MPVKDGPAEGLYMSSYECSLLASVSNLLNSSAVVVGRSPVEQSVYNPGRPVSNVFAQVGLTTQSVLI